MGLWLPLQEEWATLQSMQALFEAIAQYPRPVLIVGGHALSAHGLFRQTIDVDCLIATQDAKSFAEHLAAIGYSLVAHSENFARYRPSRLDLPEVDVLFVDADTFQKLDVDSVRLVRAGREFRVPGLEQLIALKLHAIRNEPQREARDSFDIAELLRLNPGRIPRDRLTELCERFGPPGIGAKFESIL